MSVFGASSCFVRDQRSFESLEQLQVNDNFIVDENNTTIRTDYGRDWARISEQRTRLSAKPFHCWNREMRREV